MGCTSSKITTTQPVPMVAQVNPVGYHETLNIAVVGSAGAGKSALCERFRYGTFTANSPGSRALPAPTRVVRVNGSPTKVNLVEGEDCDRGSVDGVLLVVDGTVDDPLDGAYKYVEVLCGSWSQSPVSQTFDDRGFHSRSMPASCVEIPEGYETSQSFRKIVGDAPMLDAVLSLDTSVSGAASIPLYLVFNKCEELKGSSSKQHKRRILRLKAMARNWSHIHRCGASFVSASTGQGVDNALAELIKKCWKYKFPTDAL